MITNDLILLTQASWRTKLSRYQQRTAHSWENEPQGICMDRYGTNYIREFSKSAVDYCDAESTANLTCFHHKADDKRIDSFCIGAPTIYDPASESFQLHCSLRKWDGKHDTKDVPKLDRFPMYWYNTGPHAIFNQHIKLDRVPKSSVM